MSCVLNRNTQNLSRREFLVGSAMATMPGLSGVLKPKRAVTKNAEKHPSVQTVLGPVPGEQLGVTLPHEHAPTVDWSELYATSPAPIGSLVKKMLAHTAKILNEFSQSLAELERPGAIVECTPIRVGRYPELLVDLAHRTKVHVIASTGFWCEAMAPQHPWAVRMGIERDGAQKMAELFVQEITEGMEDPHGGWGARFTKIRAGAIKIATSQMLRPSERVVHVAAALASRETGCPITTHTTNGGGLEQARLLLESGANPERVIIGHQGHKDDRENDEANDYHTMIAKLGCYLQFDRVGSENYDCNKQARQLHYLIAAGFLNQILVSHDHVPFFYREYAELKKPINGWKKNRSDNTIVTTNLVASLEQLGVSAEEIRTILVENPRRVLAF